MPQPEWTKRFGRLGDDVRPEDVNLGVEEHPDDRGPAMRPPMNAQRRARAEIVINGALVKDRRKRLGMSQVQLGLASATSARTIALIERGKSLDPPTSTTLRLAKALSVTVEALCRGAQPYTSRTAQVRVNEPEV